MTHDKPFITSYAISQDGDVTNDVAYRTVSPVVENSETKTLNETCDKPFITSDGDVGSDVAYRTVSPVIENSEM